MAEELWVTAVAEELMMPVRSVQLIAQATRRAGTPLRPAEMIAAGIRGRDVLYPPASSASGTTTSAPSEAENLPPRRPGSRRRPAI